MPASIDLRSSQSDTERAHAEMRGVLTAARLRAPRTASHHRARLLRLLLRRPALLWASRTRASGM
eukprot:2094387-Rhodomonas_salina.2